MGDAITFGHTICVVTAACAPPPPSPVHQRAAIVQTQDVAKIYPGLATIQTMGVGSEMLGKHILQGAANLTNR